MADQPPRHGADLRTALDAAEELLREARTGAVEPNAWTIQELEELVETLDPGARAPDARPG